MHAPFAPARSQPRQPGEKPDYIWQKAPGSNLFRYGPFGIYFAGFGSAGKEILRSLQTDKITIARLRLADQLKQAARLAEKQGQVRRGCVPFSEAERIWLGRMEMNPDLKPRSKDYYRQCLKRLSRSWPELGRTDIRKLADTECLNWGARLGSSISAKAFNNTVAVFRQIIAIGIELGARYDDPTRGIKPLKVRPKKATLPTPEQFESFVDTIRAGRTRHAQDQADLVLFLAYSGFRLREGTAIKWEDCDMEAGVIHARITKNGEERGGAGNRGHAGIACPPASRAGESQP